MSAETPFLQEENENVLNAINFQSKRLGLSENEQESLRDSGLLADALNSICLCFWNHSYR